MLKIAPIVWLTIFSTIAQPSFAQRIAIFQVVSHKALDEVTAGAKHALAEEKITAEIDTYNAQGNLNIAAQISQSLMSKNYAAILAVSTTAAQMAVQNNKKTPVVFAPITDPVAAKLARTIEQPGGIATGVSDWVNIKEHLKAIQKIKPGAIKVAFVYNPGEPNSKVALEQARAAAKELGITLVPKAIQNAATAATTMKSLDGIDFVYIPIDNTAASNVSVISQYADNAMIPTFGADITMVDAGATMASGVDYFALGMLAGKKITKIIKGADAGKMPVEFSTQILFRLNTKKVEKLGLAKNAALQELAKEYSRS